MGERRCPAASDGVELGWALAVVWYLGAAMGGGTERLWDARCDLSIDDEQSEAAVAMWRRCRLRTKGRASGGERMRSVVEALTRD